MNAYVKGGIVAVIAIIGCLTWYEMEKGGLPVNQSPSHFKLIDDMEKNGVPDFELPRVIGEGSVKLSAERAKSIVIVNFWASWCNPCVEEFPSMMKMIDELHGDVKIIAITSEESRTDIDSFLKAFGLPKENFEVVWDKDKSVMQKFGVEQVPESFIVGKNGKLLRKIAGTENWSTPDAIAFFKDLFEKNSK